MVGGLAWPAALTSQLAYKFSAIEWQQCTLHTMPPHSGKSRSKNAPCHPTVLPLSQHSELLTRGQVMDQLPSSPETCPTTYEGATDSSYSPAEVAPPRTGGLTLKPSAEQANAFLVGEQRALPCQSEEPPLLNTEFTSTLFTVSLSNCSAD